VRVTGICWVATLHRQTDCAAEREKEMAGGEGKGCRGGGAK